MLVYISLYSLMNRGARKGEDARKRRYNWEIDIDYLCIMHPRNLYYSEISGLRDAIETYRNRYVQEEPLNSHSPYPFIVQKSRIRLVNIWYLTLDGIWKLAWNVSMQLSRISNAINRFGKASQWIRTINIIKWYTIDS